AAGLLRPQGAQRARHRAVDRRGQGAAPRDAGGHPRRRGDHRRLGAQGGGAGPRVRPRGGADRRAGRPGGRRPRGARARGAASHPLFSSRFRVRRGRPAARLALAAALVASACATSAPPPVDFSEGPREFGPRDYDTVLERWSRHVKVWNYIDGTGIETWGGYKSWEFRQAYIERYSQVYNLSDAERKVLSTAQLDASRRTYEFHVAAQTTNYRWNDLDRANSAWRIALLDGRGAELAPKSIEVL